MNNQENKEWEKEFDNHLPQRDWYPSQLSISEQSEVKYFGYKYCQNNEIHEVTDWGHIKKFINYVLLSESDRVRKYIETLKSVYGASGETRIVNILIDLLTTLYPNNK